MRNFLANGPLRDPAGEGAGGGGAVSVTVEQMNAAINGAVAKLSSEQTAKFQAMLKPFEAIGPQLTQLTENLVTLQQQQTEQPGEKKNKPAEGDPQLNAELKRLAKLVETQGAQIKESNDARTAAEQKAKDTDKSSQLRAALSDFNFANADAADDAFNLLLSKIQWDDAGESLIAEGLPLKDFVKSYIPERKAHLLAAQGKGGAGAPGQTNKPGGSAFSTDSIKPGMSKEDQQRAAAAIVAALPTP